MSQDVSLSGGPKRVKLYCLGWDDPLLKAFQAIYFVGLQRAMRPSAVNQRPIPARRFLLSKGDERIRSAPSEI